MKKSNIDSSFSLAEQKKSKYPFNHWKNNLSPIAFKIWTPGKVLSNKYYFHSLMVIEKIICPIQIVPTVKSTVTKKSIINSKSILIERNIPNISKVWKFC